MLFKKKKKEKKIDKLNSLDLNHLRENRLKLIDYEFAKEQTPLFNKTVVSGRDLYLIINQYNDQLSKHENLIIHLLERIEQLEGNKVNKPEKQKTTKVKEKDEE